MHPSLALKLIFDFDLDCWNAKNVLCTAGDYVSNWQNSTLSAGDYLGNWQNSTLPRTIVTWKKPSWNQLVVKGWTMLYKRFPARGKFKALSSYIIHHMV